MAKGTMTIEVSAETTKAKKQINSLQRELTSGGLGQLGKGLSGLGLDGVGSSMQSLAGSLAKVAGPAGGLAVGVLAVKQLTDHVDALVQAGKEAENNFQSMSTSLTTLASNFGKVTTDIPKLTKELQMMSANGVNSFQDIDSAMKVLTVAYNGNVAQATQMVKSYDDIAAGTGMTITQLATLTAKIQESGAEYKDFNNLARKGVPIWEALGSVLNTTGDNAKQMAKEGRIGIDEWNRAVENLKENYKGLSEAMSSKTLEGAQATYAASQSLATQGATAGYSQERISGLNELSETLQKFAKNENWQATIGSLGQLQGAAENLSDTFKLWWQTVNTRAATKFFNAISGGQFSQWSEQERQLKYNQNVADLTRGYAEAKEGKLSAEQLRSLISTIEDTRFELNAEGNTGWETRLQELNDLLAKQVKLEEEKVRNQASVEATMKYGTLEQKLAAVSGKNGVPLLDDPAQIEGAVERIKQGLMANEYQDPQMMMSALETLMGLLKEYQTITNEAAKAEEELAKRREDAAKAAEKAEQDLEKQKIEGKAKVGREITAAQEELDSVNAKLERMQRARAIIADEEAHGIYREKWGGLNVSDVSSTEAELLKEQQDQTKKLEDLKKTYDNWDKNWDEARGNLRNLFKAKLPVGVNWVPAG